MARETAAQRKAREEKARDEKAKSEIVISTRTVIKFQGAEYDEGAYAEYEATFDDDSDEVTITAPWGDERQFKRSALVKLAETLA